MKAFTLLVLAAVIAGLGSAASAQGRAPTPAPKRSDPSAQPAATGVALRPGAYECWANGSSRMGMNFTVTGPGTYRNDSGAGRFSIGAGGKLALTGPMLESMPDGFIAVAHAPGGRPTVSFRSPRGAEAAFCERAE